jgi:hypothetical protein
MIRSLVSGSVFQEGIEDDAPDMDYDLITTLSWGHLSWISPDRSIFTRAIAEIARIVFKGFVSQAC